MTRKRRALFCGMTALLLMTAASHVFGRAHAEPAPAPAVQRHALPSPAPFTV